MNTTTTGPKQRDRVLEAIANARGPITFTELKRILGHRAPPSDINGLRAFGRISGGVGGAFPVSVTPAGLRRLARYYNQNAQLHAADSADTVGPADPEGPGSSGGEQLPCIEIASMQTYMYVDVDDDGQAALRVSVHHRSGDEIPAWLRNEAGTIPIRVTVNGEAVYTGGPAWPADGIDTECLVRTAVELWQEGGDADLSERQQEQLALARHVLESQDMPQHHD